VPAGRPSTLTPEHVEIAREVTGHGGALTTVASACGTPLRTVQSWLTQAKAGEGSDLHQAFLRAIQEGHHEAEIRALKIITGSQDPRDAQWWLTHNPTTRDTWSDAAAERRAVTAAMTPVMRALASFPPEQRKSMILAIEAEGGRLPEASDDSDD
jgi:DNA-directed RNA polymerase specialized sigma24 family protein